MSNPYDPNQIPMARPISPAPQPTPQAAPAAAPADPSPAPVIDTGLPSISTGATPRVGAGSKPRVPTKKGGLNRNQLNTIITVGAVAAAAVLLVCGGGGYFLVSSFLGKSSEKVAKNLPPAPPKQSKEKSKTKTKSETTDTGIVALPDLSGTTPTNPVTPGGGMSGGDPVSSDPPAADPMVAQSAEAQPYLALTAALLANEEMLAETMAAIKDADGAKASAPKFQEYMKRSEELEARYMKMAEPSEAISAVIGDKYGEGLGVAEEKQLDEALRIDDDAAIKAAMPTEFGEMFQFE